MTSQFLILELLFQYSILKTEMTKTHEQTCLFPCYLHLEKGKQPKFPNNEEDVLLKFFTFK